MGYDPNEPRDAEGKWTDGGDAIKKAASDKIKSKPSTTLIAKKVGETEKAIKIQISGIDFFGNSSPVFFWLPKSQIKIQQLGEHNAIDIPNWILNQKLQESGMKTIYDRDNSFSKISFFSLIH